MIIEQLLTFGRTWSARLVLGFHADQATEPCIDLALALKVPFAVVPCCVFAKVETPQSLENHAKSSRLGRYSGFIDYLRRKHPAIRSAKLDFGLIGGFADSFKAKNDVLYMLPEDFQKHCPKSFFEGLWDPVLNLLKAVYGLKDAPAMWARELISFFIGEGWQSSLFDESVFYKRTSTTRVLVAMVTVHVDDLGIAGRIDVVNGLIGKLQSKYGVLSPLKIQTMKFKIEE